MSVQYAICLLCVLAITSPVHAATRTSCSNERVELRINVARAYNNLAKIERKEMQSFYSKGTKCRGYLKNNLPFPTAMLKGSLRNFLGSKFLKQNYKLFRAFFDALMLIKNDHTVAPRNAPGRQLVRVNTFVTKLLWCVIGEDRSAYKPVAIKYAVELHRLYVEHCLVDAGLKSSKRKVQVIQYSEIFAELHKAVKGMSRLAARIKFFKLK